MSESNSNNLNQVEIMGNLGDSPQYRPTVGRDGLATFSLAHNKYIPNETAAIGENSFTQKTSWFRCTAWGEVAYKAAALKKGAWVHIKGKLESRTWTEKDGFKRTGVEIIVSSIKLAEVVKSQQAEADLEPAGVNTETGEIEDWMTGPLPFTKTPARKGIISRTPFDFEEDEEDEDVPVAVVVKAPVLHPANRKAKTIGPTSSKKNPTSTKTPTSITSTKTPAPAPATNNQAAVTDKQIKFIYSTGQAQGLTPNEIVNLSLEKFGVEPDELTKTSASRFIDMLKQATSVA